MALNALYAAMATLTGGNSKFSPLLRDVFLRTWDLGFTSFGGPPVHFQILHRRFVDGRGKTPWIDEQTYQEMFAVVQALPGPASTKLAFSITMNHAGFWAALMVFFIWSLPGALGMYALALGVQRIGETLPHAVYALLSGLNAATVGIVALAAVQLARKAVTDRMTRILVAGGGGAGLCYNALWYFPVLMVVGGAVTVGWDCWACEKAGKLKARMGRRRESTVEENLAESVVVGGGGVQSTSGVQRRQPPAPASKEAILPANTPEPSQQRGMSVKWGLALIAAFFAAFTALMTVRGVITPLPLPLALFNNMFLAGTVIFGGGPVVIPLLRAYVVEPGWVSPRDFLLGLALIQAFPGPNFNFAVYLGGLALAGSSTTLGAVLGFVGMFFPGLLLSVGFQSVWRAVRRWRVVGSLLRGVNAAAVGLVFTAVYRLWEIGYLTAEESSGVSLAREPWWLVVASLSFTVVEWFGVAPAAAIVGGGVAGLAWWGAVGRG